MVNPLIMIWLTDIPLVPSLVTGDPDREPNFVLHWLNNKETAFSLHAESLLQVECQESLHSKVLVTKFLSFENFWNERKI